MFFRHELPFEAFWEACSFPAPVPGKEVGALEKGLKRLAWNLSPNRSAEKLARSLHP